MADLHSDCKSAKEGYNVAMIKRDIASLINKVSTAFPAVGIVGPRQSGKTTLSKTLFPKHRYVSLEDLDARQFAMTDPRQFLQTYKPPVIFDEIQNTPSLFSYLQTAIDAGVPKGSYILTGSQNFLLMESISQTLAGRIALKTLLPLSWREIKTGQAVTAKSFHPVLMAGSYPGTILAPDQRAEWYSSYVQTYLERDIRRVQSVQDLLAFETFLRLCAGRSGQVLNISSLASDTGIAVNTAKAWLSLLHTSYIITLLKPHTTNFNKRVIKAPKLYFLDTGLAIWLLRISNAQSLVIHPLIGHLFENWVVSEVLKEVANSGKQVEPYFWRDRSGLEVDLVLDGGQNLTPVEIKAGSTIGSDFFQNLKQYQALGGSQVKQPTIIYGGEAFQKRTDAEVVPWKEIDQWLKRI